MKVLPRNRSVHEGDRSAKLSCPGTEQMSELPILFRAYKCELSILEAYKLILTRRYSRRQEVSRAEPAMSSAFPTSPLSQRSCLQCWSLRQRKVRFTVRRWLLTSDMLYLRFVPESGGLVRVHMPPSRKLPYNLAHSRPFLQHPLSSQRRRHL
jgi:hypothetical protein